MQIANIGIIGVTKLDVCVNFLCNMDLTMLVQILQTSSILDVYTIQSTSKFRIYLYLLNKMSFNYDITLVSGKPTLENTCAS